MKITQVTVGWQATQSLPEYSNVKPSLTISATLDEDEEAGPVILQLMDGCRSFVQKEVDDALEAAGRAPRYWTGPRFDVLFNGRKRVSVVVPHGTRREGELEDFSTSYEVADGIRLEAARYAALTLTGQRRGDWIILDCSDGDLSKIERALAEQAEQNPF